ncbi:MAG: hypothetical protein ABFS23_12085 [Pseudomonadota bacterium]
MGKEQTKDLKLLIIVLVVAGVLGLMALSLGGPLIEAVNTALAPGLGIKDAALWAFGITFVMFVVFAVAAGDGLIGELQFMLLGFFAFFVIITLLIAWVF